ncbi:hypothetical protein AgCh_037257 [Apium graveolens]
MSILLFLVVILASVASYHGDQLWAWTRLPTLAPVPRGTSLDDPIWGNRLGPFGMRWCSHLSFVDTSLGVLATHRLSLDGLAPSHFIWQSNTSEIFASLPPSCIDDSSIWFYKGPLICFFIVEPHAPNRCLRQFGFIQEIPPNESYSKELHKIKLQGKQDSDWTFVHHDHVSHWVDRALHVVTGISGSGVIDGYAEWYSRITRLFHTRLVAKGVIVRDMSYIESIANNFVNLLQEQFNHGVFQDFPLEARREKEIEIQKKPERGGHKGGCGGVNAPRDEGEILGDTSTQVHENEVDERGETVLSHLHEEMTDNVPQFNLGIPQTPPPYQSSQVPVIICG